MENKTRYEVIYDIMDCYDSLTQKEMRAKLEELVSVVKAEAVKQLRAASYFIEKI